MTVIEAINKVDSLKPNTYSEPEKIGWLSSADLIIKHRVLDSHELNDGETAITDDDLDYASADAGREKDLILPMPYDEAYIHYLSAQIDYWNHEIPKYNNSMAMFNSVLNAFANEWNRTHMPKGVHKFKYF